MSTKSQPKPVRYGENMIRDIDDELCRIERKNGPMYHSAHEAYGVILEELDEVWEIVKLKRGDRDPESLRKELVQVAACAIRAIHSIPNMVDPQ